MKQIVCLIIFFLSLDSMLFRDEARADRPTLKYNGTAFVKIKTSDGKIIYIDPYAVTETDSADIVLITHEHSDHNEITRITQKSSCRFIRVPDALQQGVYQSFVIGQIVIHAVPAYNTYHLKSDGVGYIIEFDNLKVYHAGGTGNIPEMADLSSRNINYTLLPITAGPEALTQAAAVINARHDIPIHTNDPGLIARFTSPHKLVLTPGQTIELTNDTIAASVRILRVPQDYPTIQSAIDAAEPADTVIVSEGTYHENIKYHGKGIVLTSKFYLTKNWQTVFQTIIDGSSAVNKDTASTVQFLGREDSTAVLDGFTIRGGTGTKYMFPFGTGSTAYQEGAGIVLHYSSAVIKHNFIVNNTVTPASAGARNGGGGGIASMYGNPTIANNIIASNIAGYAGGIVLNWSGGKVRNNIVYRNSGGTPYGCGGIMVWQVPANSAFVENNTVIENSSQVDAGGINIKLLDNNTIPVVRNNIVWGNTQVSGSQCSQAQFGTYNNIQDYSGGTTISGNPQFISGSRFLLSSTSPCIDAGDTSAVCHDKETPAGAGQAALPSQGFLRNDIGAYGGPGAEEFPEFSTVGVQEQKSLNHNFILHQNFPNPFNPVTVLSYQLPAAGFVHLKVYDVAGREIRTLVNEVQEAGMHRVSFDGSKLTSGAYFCRLQTNEFSDVKKMLVLK